MRNPIIASSSSIRILRNQLSGSVGLVPTMGALHDGHIALLKTLRTQVDHLVISIYVNPLQFAPHEDLSRYPRPLSQDIELSAPYADIIFHPENLYSDEQYPSGKPEQQEEKNLI